MRRDITQVGLIHLFQIESAAHAPIKDKDRPDLLSFIAGGAGRIAVCRRLA
jgi:hypothetical protein